MTMYFFLTYYILTLAMDIECSSVELNKAIVPVDFSEPKDGTLENLLIWGRNKRNNVS